jgi:hypothetical protein
MKKYLNERNEKLYSRLFENQGIKVKEGDYDTGGDAKKPDKFGPPMKEEDSAFADVALGHPAVQRDFTDDDSKEELKQNLIDLIAANIAATGDRLDPKEVKDAVWELFNDIKDNLSKLGDDVSDAVKRLMKNEVHAIETPKEKDLDTD